MDKIFVKCPAKINLSLDVVGKREDGYHLLKMIMQSVALFDEITVSKSNNGIGISCNKPEVPENESNIAYKAAKLMFDRYNIKDGLDIKIDKRIPVAAGLAGGSTDAAGVIKAINKLYKLNLSKQEMMEIGLMTGSDVPYCILGGTALAEGIGEVLTPLKAFDSWCVIAKPSVSVSTKEVYKKLKINEIPRHPNIDKLMEYIDEGDSRSLAQGMTNVLETVTVLDHPVILEIKNIMMEFYALGSLMSGSGPSVFGLFDNKNEAEACYNRLRDYLKEVFLVKTYNEE